MKKQDNGKQRLIEVMSRLDKTFKPKLNEEFDQPVNDFFPITTPIGSEDDKLFVEIVNQGIDSHLEGFTKSKFSVENTSIGKRRKFDFHKSELPILLRRLEELGTEDAFRWKTDIENYDNNINEDFDQPVEEFIPHGTYTVSNAGGYEIMLDDSGDAAMVRDAFGSDNPQTSDWLPIEYIGGKPVIDPNGYNIPLNQVMRLQENDDNWIHKAVDPKHKGYCTPMTKDTCTPARKALAKRFKAGIEDENVDEDIKYPTPEEYKTKVERIKQSMDKLFNDENYDIIDTLFNLLVSREKNTPQFASLHEAINNKKKGIK